MNRPMTTSEGLSELEGAIARLAPVAVSGNIGCHSLKATVLSWLGKRGVEGAYRRLLGYHVKPKDNMLVLYSRDALGPPLRAAQGDLRAC